ncbi:hypothetical protein Pmani_002373 [Petrolisthes manimaculis]|uniref:Uncharacterized protein n=1 Tax=Petrolisthes manimaculis TaxID=1843537 RepID=A0AAE1QHP4_9EUCA|nr:hypothetical protein Pmani_002373 [Petrolisthes manimaculis]
MEDYMFRELADMHLIYGAAHLYSQRCPNRRHSHYTTCSVNDRRLGETGTMRPNPGNRGRPRDVCIPELEERILEEVGMNKYTLCVT